MDSLEEIIDTFGIEDRTEFRRFLKRTKSNDNRKDLQLFQLISDESVTSKEYHYKLYQPPNQAAYLACRKRLSRSINKFIALKLIDSDSSNVSEVLNWVNMARYLFSNQKSELALKYLKKAERSALKNDLFEVLNTIYVYQIQYLPQPEQSQRIKIVRKWEKNKKALELNEKSEIALSIIHQKIVESNNQGTHSNILELITGTLNNLNLSTDFLINPRFIYNLTHANRKLMLSKKDFYNLEPFIINQYSLIQKQNGFAAKYNYYQLGFLYMIAHTLYRNKKFDKAYEYVLQLEEELKKASKTQIAELKPKLVLLKSNLFIFKKDLHSSLQLLQQEFTQLSLNSADKLKFISAIGIVQFLQGKPKQSLASLNTMNHSNNWCAKIMGREWLLKRLLMEVILYSELEEFELVDSRIRNIRRSFRDLLAVEPYNRAKPFLSIIKQINSAGNTANNSGHNLSVLLESLFNFLPAEQEDLQAMLFYAWLKSKAAKKSFYEVLLEIVS